MNGKTLTSLGIVVALGTALMSPEFLGKLSGREVFWLLLAAVFCTTLGEGALRWLKGGADTRADGTGKRADDSKDETDIT